MSRVHSSNGGAHWLECICNCQYLIGTFKAFFFFLSTSDFISLHFYPKCSDSQQGEKKVDQSCKRISAFP